MVNSASVTLSSTEQAAALLMSLDKADAAAVMRAMVPRDLHRVVEAMTMMSAPNNADFLTILRRFHRDVADFSGVKVGVSDAVSSLLKEALGEERAKL
ncbi:MAG: flagellar motor switch protein FliG, partial [Zhongshania aliphaticivorans]|uniref:hypothetical protein n=1 Tax=Zhongshania aliphaticivorans TaxID=1470434 RepID=UPI0039E4FAD2